MNTIAIERREQFERECPNYLNQVFRYILKMTRNETEAEEITQTAILAFLELMDKTCWEHEVRNVRAYLRRIARNVYVDSWKIPREEGLVADDEQSEQVRQALLRQAMQNNNPTARLESKMYYEELFKALPLQIILGGLSEYELKLLYMDAVEEMSPKEIAQEVDGDVDRVRYQLNRIYAKIRWRVRRLL